MLDEHLLESFIGARVFDQLVRSRRRHRRADGRGDALHAPRRPRRHDHARRHDRLSRRTAACARCPPRSTRGAPAGVVDQVPAFASVTVHYDPARVARRSRDVAVRSHRRRSSTRCCRTCATSASAAAPRRDSRVLRRRARARSRRRRARNTRSRRRTSSTSTRGADYLVYMVGFMPGFAYLGGLPARARDAAPLVAAHRRSRGHRRHRRTADRRLSARVARAAGT